jgi:hypothetical protein
MDTVAAMHPPFPAGSPADILAGEGALLLRDVRRRAEPVLALAAARSWPEQELTTLTSFLRRTVLRQICEEEQAHPAGANGPFATLTAEHVLLQALTDDLEGADRATWGLPELADEVSRLLRVLEQHLRTEQALLATQRH